MNGAILTERQQDQATIDHLRREALEACSCGGCAPPVLASPKSRGHDPYRALLLTWEDRARAALPIDAMLINKHVRELGAVIASNAAAAVAVASIAPAEAKGDAQSPWQSIDDLPRSDDLFWFMRWDAHGGYSTDGPRAPQFGDGEDAEDGWMWFAPCEAPSHSTPQPADGGAVANLRDVLGKIARWELPETGETWPSGGAVSYEAAHGSQGVRRYFQQVARDALVSNPPVAQVQQEAYPMDGGDRAVLTYLMHQFDAESWECPNCGHSEDTATMDSADYLRRYLATHPTGDALGAVPAARQATDGSLSAGAIRTGDWVIPLSPSCVRVCDERYAKGWNDCREEAALRPSAGEGRG